MRICHVNPIYGNHNAEKCCQSRGVRAKFPQSKSLTCQSYVVSFGGKFSASGKKHPLRFSNNRYTACSAEKSIENVVGRFRDKIKIIFSDIDGTISPHDDEVSKEVVDIFEKLHLQNIPTILTTGRCYGDCVPILNSLKHKPEYTISLQGGEIVDKNGDLITASSISHKSANSLKDWYSYLYSKISNLHLIMYFDDLPYSLTDIQFPWKSSHKIVHVKDFDELIESGKRLQKALFYKPDAQSGTPLSDKIQKSFVQSGLEELEMKVLGIKFYEFQNKGITKDKAIEFLLEKQGILPENVMVIGDSANDIEMLDYIAKRGGLSVAMGNATPEVKNYANAITSSVNENGAVKALKLLFNID